MDTDMPASIYCNCEARKLDIEDGTRRSNLKHTAAYIIMALAHAKTRVKDLRFEFESGIPFVQNHGIPLSLLASTLRTLRMTVNTAYLRNGAPTSRTS